MSESNEINITAKTTKGDAYKVTIDKTSTILDLKKALVDQCEIAPEFQRLIYSGHVLKDDQTIETYGIQDGHTIHLVRGKAPSSEKPQGSQSQSQTQSQTTSNTGTTGSTGQTSPGGFPFDSGSFANMFQNPSFQNMMNSMGGSSGQGGLPFQMDPNMIQTLLSNPAIQNMMNQMMSNPELMQSLLSQSPLFGGQTPFMNPFQGGFNTGQQPRQQQNKKT